MSFKAGDILYTSQFNVGVFRCYGVVENKVFTDISRYGWVYLDHKDLKLANIEDFKRNHSNRITKEEFLKENSLNEPVYEIY